MGKVLDDDIAKNVASFKQKAIASYPLMVYAVKCGDVIILNITQSFENKIYVENLLKILEIDGKNSIR